MELGHLLTRSGLTYPEVSSKVYHDSFCQLGSSVSLPWVICYYYYYYYYYFSKEHNIYQRPSLLMQLATDFKVIMKLCILEELISVSRVSLLEDAELVRLLCCAGSISEAERRDATTCSMVQGLKQVITDINRYTGKAGCGRFGVLTHMLLIDVCWLVTSCRQGEAYCLTMS